MDNGVTLKSYCNVMEPPTINQPLHGLEVNALVSSCPYKDADTVELFFFSVNASLTCHYVWCLP